MRHVIPVVSRWIQALSWVNLCHPFSDFRSLFILSYEWKEVVLSGDPSEESKNGTDDLEARWKKMAKWPEVLMSALNIYQQLNRQLFVSVSRRQRGKLEDQREAQDSIVFWSLSAIWTSMIQVPNALQRRLRQWRHPWRNLSTVLNMRKHVQVSHSLAKWARLAS